VREGDVHASLISGDEFVLHNCVSINDVKVQVANRYGKFSVDVEVSNKKMEELTDLEEPPPERVIVALKQDAKFHDSTWAQCMESHANSGDIAGVEKAVQNAIDHDHNEEDAHGICGQALLQTLSFAPNLDDEKRMWSSVDILLKCQANVNYSSPEGQTPLLEG